MTLAGISVVAMAYVAEVDVSATGSAMGLDIAGGALGGMGGRLIASLVADIAGWRWALGMVGIVGRLLAEAFHRLALPSRHFAPRNGGWMDVIRSTGPLFRDPGLRLL